MISSELKEALIQSQTSLRLALEQLEKTPDVTDSVELLNALEVIDRAYQQMCDETDRDYEDDVGSTYEQGTDSEFYIEASWWHDVSVILRKYRPRLPVKQKTNNHP